MQPPQITLHKRYNPHSRTLRGPYWVTGLVRERVTELEPHKRRINEGKPACFGESIPPGVMQWFDFGLQPHSGDLVMVIGHEQITKRWCEVNGEVFLCCHFYTVPLSWVPNIRAVGVLVAEATIDGWLPHIAHQVMTTDEDDAQWRAELNAQPKVHKAIGHMLKHGIPTDQRQHKL